MDGDLLGLSAGTLVSAVVLAVSCYWQALDMFTIMIRVGMAFIITYIAIFLFARLALYTLICEAEERKKTAALAEGAGDGSETVGEEE